MPNALITLPDVYESVTRRVSVDLVSQLAKIMRLPENTSVYLPGNADVIPMNGGAFGDCCDPGVKYPAEAKLVMRITEEVDENYTLVTPVFQQEHRPLFVDPIRDIRIQPVYRYVNLQATFEYNAPNIVVAQRWLDEMRIRISSLRAELYHSLEYHYGIPRPVMHLLRYLHSLLEESDAPTGMDFNEYFSEYVMQPVKGVTTLIDTHEIPVVPEKQYEVLGWFDFTTTPSTPEKQDTGNYIASFGYNLFYHRPMQLYCTYPMVMHNTPVDPMYRDDRAAERFKEVTRRVSTTKGSFDALQASLEVTGLPYLHYPANDDWQPDFIPKDRLTFFSGLLLIQAASPREIVNLYELGDYTFTPYFLEYLLQEGDRIFNKTESIFEFRLYRNKQHLNNVVLSFIPGTLTIQTDVDLDVQYYYHIQISFRRNWYTVSSTAIERLRYYPVVAYSALKSLGVNMINGYYKDLPLLGIGITPPPYGQGTLIDDPLNGGTWPWPWLEASWSTVGWPGTLWEEEDTGWPGGGWSDVVWPEGDIIPTWPADVRLEHQRGVLPIKLLRQAVEQTDDLAGNYIDRRRVGPLLVLYAQILSKRR